MSSDAAKSLRKQPEKHDTIQDVLLNKLVRLDVEYGNVKGFFSAEKRGFHVLDAEQRNQTNEYETSIPAASISITDSVTATENKINRSTQFRVTRDSKLYDLVSRFVVLSNDRVAKIASNEIKHSCGNLYYQYATDDVIVPVGEKGYLRFLDNGSSGHSLFENVFYIRDEAVERSGMKRWIIHHRMIVKQREANLIVRCCHPMLEGPLPLQGLIPQALKNRLFRIREREFPNFPFMAVGESAVNAGHTFDIRTCVQLMNE